MSRFRLLILGGTSEGIELAKQDYGPEMHVTYSIAGLVRTPRLACDVIAGGFKKHGGLTSYLKSNDIAAVLDATHPYAVNISSQARKSAEGLSIPYWRFERPPWQKQDGDAWFEFEEINELVGSISNFKNVLLTAGQFEKKTLDRLTLNLGQKQYLRTLIQPELDIPDTTTWIQGIGPFDLESELSLLRRYDIDALVTKNSGGSATAAKLQAARIEGLPVFILNRPKVNPSRAEKEFQAVEECTEFVKNYIKRA